jgi:hypothetical protein
MPAQAALMPAGHGAGNLKETSQHLCASGCGCIQCARTPNTSRKCKADSLRWRQLCQQLALFSTPGLYSAAWVCCGCATVRHEPSGGSESWPRSSCRVWQRERQEDSQLLANLTSVPLLDVAAGDVVAAGGAPPFAAAGARRGD